MIIPANEHIAKNIARIPLHFKVMLDYLDYICTTHCNEDILVYEVHDKYILMDIPSKSGLNGVKKLMSVMNVAWSYDLLDISEKTLFLACTPRGKFLCLRKGSRTTDMHPSNLPLTTEELHGKVH